MGIVKQSRYQVNLVPHWYQDRMGWFDYVVVCSPAGPPFDPCHHQWVPVIDRHLDDDVEGFRCLRCNHVAVLLTRSVVQRHREVMGVQLE